MPALPLCYRCTQFQGQRHQWPIPPILPRPRNRRFRPGPGLLALIAFAAAAVLALLLSFGLARVVETRSVSVVTSRLLAEGYTWAHVQADGLVGVIVRHGPE